MRKISHPLFINFFQKHKLFPRSLDIKSREGVERSINISLQRNITIEESG